MNEFAIIIFVIFAGPVIGSFLGIGRKYTQKQIGYLLVFSAGVMVAVSVFDLLPESLDHVSLGVAVFGLFMGGAMMRVLNKALPHHHPECADMVDAASMKRTALFVFLGISIHNLPEGLAIGFGSLADFSFSLIIALAIALHDIPEAICIAAPYYFATGSRPKALFMTMFTVVPTIIGFLLSYFLLKGTAPATLGLLVSLTAGVMFYISLAELIPGALKAHKFSRLETAATFLAGGALVLMLHGLIGG